MNGKSGASTAEENQPAKKKYDYFYGRKAEQYAYVQLPWLLIRDEQFESLTMDAKVLYSIMLNYSSMSARNGWLDEENRVYIIYPIAKIMKDLRCGNQKAGKLVHSLEKIGLIEKKKPGQGKANRFYVLDFTTGLENEHPEIEHESEDIYSEYSEQSPYLLKGTTSTGTPVDTGENFANSKETEFGSGGNDPSEAGQQSHFQKCKNHIPESVKSTFQEVRKSHANNKDINNTDLNYTNPSIVSLRKDDGCDEMRSSGSNISPKEKRKACMDALKEQVEYALLASETDTERLDEILGLMTDVMCSTRKTIRISGEDMPAGVVKSRFMKVGYFEMQYILDALGDPGRRIRNIRAYMLATIYNAPLTLHSHTAAEVSADMAGSRGRDAPASLLQEDATGSRREAGYAV